MLHTRSLHSIKTIITLLCIKQYPLLILQQQEKDFSFGSFYMWWVTTSTIPPTFSIGNLIKYLNYQSLHSVHNSACQNRLLCLNSKVWNRINPVNMMGYLLTQILFGTKVWLRVCIVFQGPSKTMSVDDLEIFGMTCRTISTNPLFRIEYVPISGKHPYVVDKLHS